jgi:DNA-binding transcriptional LysR family regulator
VELFERHARGVTLTDAGTAYLEKAALALAAVEEAEEVPRALDGPPRLVVGFPRSAGKLARRVLRPFMRSHPGIEIHTRHLAPHEQLAELKRGNVDAELAFPPPEDPELEERPVVASPRYVLLSEHHRLAHAQSLTFAQISSETMPGRHVSLTERWAHEAYLMKYRREPPPLTAEQPTSLNELWTLVSRGRAIGILPEFMAETTQGDGVRAIPLSGVDPVLVCLCVIRENRRSAVRELVSSIPEPES